MKKRERLGLTIRPTFLFSITGCIVVAQPEMIRTRTEKVLGGELGSNQKHEMVLLSLRCLLDIQGQRSHRQLDVKSVGYTGLDFQRGLDGYISLKTVAIKMILKT